MVDSIVDPDPKLFFDRDFKQRAETALDAGPELE